MDNLTVVTVYAMQLVPSDIEVFSIGMRFHSSKTESPLITEQ